MANHDAAIITAISDIRAKHHACTAAAVAARLRLSQPYLHELVHGMVKRNLLAYTEMPGSLRALDPIPTDEATAPVSDGKPTCEVCGQAFKSNAGVAAHRRFKHPDAAPASDQDRSTPPPDETDHPTPDPQGQSGPATVQPPVMNE